MFGLKGEEDVDLDEGNRGGTLVEQWVTHERNSHQNRPTRAHIARLLSLRIADNKSSYGIDSTTTIYSCCVFEYSYYELYSQYHLGTQGHMPILIPSRLDPLPVQVGGMCRE